MPYLEFLFCEKCQNAPMDIDYRKTIESYCIDGRRQEDAFINPAMLVWDYLIYTCTYCGESNKYTFRDVERRVRERLSQHSEEFREYFEKVGNIDFKVIQVNNKVPKYGEDVKERIKDTYVSKT